MKKVKPAVFRGEAICQGGAEKKVGMEIVIKGTRTFQGMRVHRLVQSQYFSKK